MEDCYDFQQKITCVTTALGYTHCEHCDKYDYSDYDYEDEDFVYLEEEVEAEEEEDEDEYCYLAPALKEDCR